MRIKYFSFGSWTNVTAGLFLSAIGLLSCGCNPSSTGSSESGLSMGTGQKPELPQQTVFLVEQFCGSCHPTPSPASFPRAHWPTEVERGFEFYFESGRHDLEIPRMVDAVQYFQGRAPLSIDLPPAESFPKLPTSVRFEPGPLMLAGEPKSLTADIKWDADTGSVFFSDMANAKLRQLSPPKFVELGKPSSGESITLPTECAIAEGNHLCKMTACDWNGDQIRDYMIGEIGSMIISDQHLGTVAVYLGQPDKSFQRVVLAEALARPVEAVPIDYDEDGDLDVLIAEFGYNKEGCLSLLRNQTVGPTEPSTSASKQVKIISDQLRYEVVDPRHGHLAIIVQDINADSKPDIITALGQEYETVQVRISAGKGNYESHVALALPDPAYNTSSIQLADIDGDGLMDLVHTCGDIFDSFVPKPYHGVRWLRNKGNGVWETRELGMLIGAMQSAVVDFDGDGDMDIAAVGLFPQSDRDPNGVSLDSVVWWEQLPDLQFARHSIERDRSLHSSCMAHDLDGDNRPELIVGEWAQDETPATLRVFWNRSANSTN